MYDDIRLHVARSYTSSADSPFSLMSSFTLSNHLLLCLPLFLLPYTFITIALLPTTSTFCPVFSCDFPHFRCPSYSFISYLSSFITPHIHRSILISVTSNLFSCAFFNALVSAPHINAGISTVLYTLIPRDLHVHSFVAQHSLPVIPPALHSVGDFRIQFSVLRQSRSQVGLCEYLHSIYCLSL